VDAARVISRSLTPSPKNKNNGQENVLSAEDIIVDLSPMHYGMQEKNPLDFIKFYSKHRPNECSIAEWGDISLLMPASFAEVLLRVYTRDVRYFGVIQAGYRRVLQTMPVLDAVGLSTVTPPATEPPSTPRSHSRNPSLGTVAGTMSRGNTPKAAATPFARPNNVYTTVSMNHSPASPTRNKRDRDTDDGPEEGRLVKKQRER